MTNEMKNTPILQQNLRMALELQKSKPFDEKQKKKLKQHLIAMYVGLVFRNWADGKKTKLGTAKQKALQQMESFAKTFEKDKEKNPMAYEVAKQVEKLKKFVSKQIMNSKTSEMVLSEKSKEKYRKFGEQLTQKHMAKLRGIFQKEQQNVKTNEKTVQSAKPTQQMVLQMLIQQRMQNAA